MLKEIDVLVLLAQSKLVTNLKLLVTIKTMTEEKATLISETKKNY